MGKAKGEKEEGGMKENREGVRVREREYRRRRDERWE